MLKSGGALQGASADRYSVERFNKAARVNLRFTTPFMIAYDSLVGLKQAESADAVVGPGGFSDESAGSNMAESADKKHESQAEENRHDSRGDKDVVVPQTVRAALCPRA